MNIDTILLVIVPFLVLIILFVILFIVKGRK